MSNPQWCKRFNTKVDIAAAVGVTQQHKVLLEHVAQELHTQAFNTLTVAEQEAVREDVEERHLSHAFLWQSGPQHANLKVDLQNDFTTGDNHYPKNCQQTLHLLNKHSKTAVTKTSQSEGTLFAQKGGRGGAGRGSGQGNGRGKGKEPCNKQCWADKQCYRCHKDGHPSLHCPENETDDDSSRASTASSMKKLTKDMKSMKKAFTAVNTQLQQLKEAKSDLSNSEDEEEDSHFQCNFQFAQMAQERTTVEPNFEPRNARLFKQSHGTRVKLDLKEVMLLDNQSTMDLTCNPSLVERTFKSSNHMRLKSNGGKMKVTRKAMIPGYHADVWFSTRAITNILALHNVILQHYVTYNSIDKSFMVHREHENKPNMEFVMHKSGLHYYDPRDKDFVFVNTVSGNKEGFMKRQIKGAEVTRTLYTTLSYPSKKDFKWVIQSNQIKDCPVTVQDVNVATLRAEKFHKSSKPSRRHVSVISNAAFMSRRHM